MSSFPIKPMKQFKENGMKKYVFALCLTSTSLAWGACERADVEFYLNKGFTPEQITNLCGQATAPVTQNAPVVSVPSVPVSQPAVQQPVTPVIVPVVTQPAQKVISQAKIDDIVARLNESLRVKNVVVSNHKFMFTHIPAIEYGTKRIGGDFREVKPEIHVSIPMNTLRVLTSSEGIPMVRSPYIKLGGDISRTVKNADGYSQQKRDAINTYISNQGPRKIKLKFQRGAAVDEATSDLKDLIDMYR